MSCFLQELCKNVMSEMNMKDFVVCYGKPKIIDNSFWMIYFRCRQLWTYKDIQCLCKCLIVQLCRDVIDGYILTQMKMIIQGMTETSPVTFQGFASDSLAVRTGTIGFPANHVEVHLTLYLLICHYHEMSVVFFYQVAVMDPEGHVVEAGVEVGL